MQIQMIEVSKSYHGTSQNQELVLDCVNFTLERGEFVYVVGGSGAGKSSLLKILACEEAPTRGTLKLFGSNPMHAQSSHLRSMRRSIGYIPQNHNLIRDLSVFDNVALSLSLSKVSKSPAENLRQINQVLEQLGLIGKSDALVEELSGGEAQRVAIARAIVRKPEILIADEPTGAQDKNFAWAVMEIFAKLNHLGTSVVVATHDREIVRKFRKKCAVLKNGKMTMEDTLCSY